MTQVGTHRRFGFDTEFGDDGDAPQPAAMKRFFSLEDVEHLTRKAAEETRAHTLATLEGRSADALEQIAQVTRAALDSLSQSAHEYRAGAAILALACGRTIAGAAFDLFPQAPAAAALESLARELESAPRLTVRVPADVLEAVQAALNETAQAVGYAGHIRCIADPALPAAAFSFDWGDGRASFDPVQASQRVGEALTAALAAEGLHGEALSTSEPSDHG